MVGLFEQHMAEPELRGARRGAEPRRARADDRDPHRPAHAAAPMALTPIMHTPITQTQARTSTSPPRQPLGDHFRMRPGPMPRTRRYSLESGKSSTGDGYRGGVWFRSDERRRGYGGVATY